MYRAIAFDLWETLITNDPTAAHSHRELRLERLGSILARSGFPAGAVQLDHAYRASWDVCQERYWSRDIDVPCRCQVEHFLEGLNLDPSSVGPSTLATLEEAYAMVAVDVLPALVPGADAVLRALRERDLRIGLISNTGRTPGYALRRILEKLELAPLFDAMIFSNEHGACKPQRSIFESLRSALGVRFEEMLFVGDNLYVDVHGAQQCGITGVHFIPAVRGTAVAPPVEHGMVIKAAATVRELREVLAFIDAGERNRELQGSKLSGS